MLPHLSPQPWSWYPGILPGMRRMAPTTTMTVSTSPATSSRMILLFVRLDLYLSALRGKTKNYIAVASNAISVAYNVREKLTTPRMWGTSEAPLLSPYPLPPCIFISHGHVNVDAEGVGDILFRALYTIKLHIKALLNWSIIKPLHIFSPSSGSLHRIWQNTWTLHNGCQKSPPSLPNNQCAPRHFQLPPPQEAKPPQIHSTAEPHTMLVRHSYTKRDIEKTNVLFKKLSKTPRHLRDAMWKWV